MARVRLIHWHGPEGRERQLRLAALGHHVEFDEGDGTAQLRLLRASVPDAVVIDLSRLPSHGRETALAIRSSPSTRSVPIVFVDGDPVKVAKLKALLPDAAYTSWGRLKTTIPRAVAAAPVRPVVPGDTVYAHRSTAEKLGVKEGARVALLNAPPRFPDTLQPLPQAVTFTAKPDAMADLFVCFVKSSRELTTQLSALAAKVNRQTLWIASPKKSSGVKSDLDGNIVREAGLAAGWVDFKVCSIDDTWSGLAFKRRK